MKYDLGFFLKNPTALQIGVFVVTIELKTRSRE